MLNNEASPIQNKTPIPPISAKNRANTLATDREFETPAISASNKTIIKPINYKNGKKIEKLMYSYDSYFKHQEKIPKHYYPLVQYLENVEVKYHNDNLFEDSPLGFPTRAQ